MNDLIRRGDSANNPGSNVPVPWVDYAGEYPAYAPSGGLRQQLTGLLDLVMRRKFTLVGIFLLVVAIAAVSVMLKTPVYHSHAWVLVNLDASSSKVSAATGVVDNSVPTWRSLRGEIQLLQISNPLAERVADRLVELDNVQGSAENMSILEGEDGVRVPKDVVAQRLEYYVRFEVEGGEGNVIRMTATSAVPGEAALIANLYADEYVELTRDANRAHLSASRQFLEEQEEKWRSELYEAEEAVRRSGSYEGSSSLDEKGGFLVGQIAQLESQRDQAGITLQMRRSTVASLERELQRINPQMANQIASSVDQEIEAVRTRIGELEMSRKEIILRYPDEDPTQLDHPQLEQIERQLASLRLDLRRLSAEYVNEVEATGGVAGTGGLQYVSDLRRRIAEQNIEISGLEAQMESLDRRLQSYLGELGRLPSQSLQVARLERSRQHATQMYESVVGRLQEVLVAEQSEPGYARIIRQAAVPFAPTEPNVPRTILLGIVVGLMFGIGSAIVADKVDNRFYRPETVTESGYELIAVIPDITTLVKDDFDGKAFVRKGTRDISTALVGLLSPSSAATEAYRHLRTYIQFSGQDQIVKRILVTSSSMAEGKSVTAANLALVMAQSGRKTLLIDGDLRRPRLHVLFGIENEPGLTDIVGSEKSMVNGEFDSIGQEIAENLTVLPAGSATKNPAELLGSPRVRSLLGSLDERFDVVIFDSPPVRAATDATLLSTQFDATLIVARASKTKEAELDLVFKQLGSVGAQVLGVVFNGFDVKMAYGYKYMYSDYEDYASYSAYQHLDS